MIIDGIVPASHSATVNCKVVGLGPSGPPGRKVGLAAILCM